MDIRNENEISSITIDGEPDVIWYNQHKNLLYCAIGNPGLIEVIDTRKFVSREKIKIEEGAHTFAFNLNKQTLYSFLPQSCRVAVFAETD